MYLLTNSSDTQFSRKALAISLSIMFIFSVQALAASAFESQALFAPVPSSA